MKELDCEIERICDAAGNCEPGSGTIGFRMEPIELAAGGVGSYTIRYGDTEAPMHARSEVGPFIWTVGSARHAVMASSETRFLWHELIVDPEPEARIRFMRCRFQL